MSRTTRIIAVASSTIQSGFLESAERFPNRPALWVDGVTMSYAELLHRAQSLAATLQQRVARDGTTLVGVFADRSVDSFAGILGSLLAGCGYVPLNPTFPVARTKWMMQRAGCRALIVDSSATAQLECLLSGGDHPQLVLLPGQRQAAALAKRCPQHQFADAQNLVTTSSFTPTRQSADETAYLLFTSGSTGTPKGVAITHGNVVHFLDSVAARYQFSKDDRFSQTFDTTFDLSVFDMFAAWGVGACVCCPSRSALLNPDRFIRDLALTVWFSVPTVAALMNRFNVLKANRYPTLRWSLFCGEALPVDLAEAWSRAAPGSVIENLYGPTELTVACSAYRWDATSRDESEAGIVPIGALLPGMEARVVNEALSDVEPGEVGELLIAGPQRSPGYWRDDEATAVAHIRLPDGEQTYYKTGDRVRRPIDGRPFCFLGRVDQQIKVRGHRVELGEIETVLRRQPGVQNAVALGWPLETTGASGIAAFLTGTDIQLSQIRESLRSELQGYAIPHSIRVLSEFPRNANGKVDRQALIGMLHL